MSDQKAQDLEKRRAFEREALPHMDALYRTALRMTKNQNDAEDLIQEAVVRQFELSGKPNTNPKYNKHYQFMYIAHNAMSAYLKTWIRQMSYSTVDDLFDPEINPIQRGLKRAYSLDYGWTYY